MVFAGGGFRFACYLGMYAAAVETGNKPDVLLASCGGAIAAAVIKALPDDRQRKAWVASPAMYRFLAGVRATPNAAVIPVLASAVTRRLRRTGVERIPDLFNDYLFDADEELPLPDAVEGSDIAVAIIGGKLLFDEREAGQPRGMRKLFAETVFCESRTAALLQGVASHWSDPRYGEHAIASELLIETNVAMRDAVRISIADMFYFRCHTLAPGSYTGGVVDLFPIELAHRLARRTVMELKAPFNQALAIPALRAVLGIDGNRRLRHVHSQRADAWIDTSDISRVLRNSGAQKRIDWIRNRIRLVLPSNHDAYVEQVEAQWQYGYQRAREAFARPVPNDKTHMRHVTKHNRADA